MPFSVHIMMVMLTQFAGWGQFFSLICWLLSSVWSATDWTINYGWAGRDCLTAARLAKSRPWQEKWERGEQATLELICAGQVVKLERTLSYSWAPVVPHQKKSEQQSGSRTTCPTCSQAAPAQVVIPPCMKLTSCWCVCRLRATANSQFPWVVRVCVSHDLRERLIHVATFALFVYVCECVRGILAKTKNHKSSWVRCWHKEITHKKSKGGWRKMHVNNIQ